MPDRKARPDQSAPAKKTWTRDDERSSHDHPDLGEQKDPDSQESTEARPHGHTEDPDRTL
jgi:hypothetical protein